MGAKTQRDKIIFGLKVRHLRQAEGLSFAELSRRAKMSVSYLNEIEKGKKYPKADKITVLSEVLGANTGELTSGVLPQRLQPVENLLRSNFLNELPLDLFGIDVSKVIEIIASAPTRVNAFISTLLEISQHYSLQNGHFYFAALRSFLELNNNYFEEIEEAVRQFREDNALSTDQLLSDEELKQLLISKYKYKIIEGGLNQYPELQQMRSVFLSKNKKLLLNQNLTPVQRTFQFGKEIAFQYLNLKARANTSSLHHPQTFEEVLNHSKAIYFSDALLMPLDAFVKDVKNTFQEKKWSGTLLLNLMDKYRATPEMLYHRLTNVLPQFFGINSLFFIRIKEEKTTNEFTIDRELHINCRLHTHNNGLREHYCRRWTGIQLLNQLRDEGTKAGAVVKAGKITHLDTNETYLCLSIARPEFPTQKTNINVTIGLRINKALLQKISFINDSGIPHVTVNRTCERCALTDCADRVAPPIIIRAKQKKLDIKERIDLLNR